MLIATNAPEYFVDDKEYSFVLLGTDDKFEASFILLMLSTNWNSKSIEQIEALTYHIANYPEETPAFIIGAEFQFPPSAEIAKIKSTFRNPNRDIAVSSLCSTVLERSSSIGVRGKVTKEYLVDVLGFAADKIDIVFDPSKEDNRDGLSKFIERNKVKLGIYFNEILNFQKKPRVFNELPKNFRKEIFISRPFLERNGNKIRLCINLELNGRSKTIWVETASQHSEHFITDRLDPFLLVLIPFAMRKGHDLVSETPISDRLFYNINEVLIPNLCAGDSRLHKTNLLIPSCGEAPPSGSLTATGMSCGIDSFYSAMTAYQTGLETHKLNALYCGNYLYGNEGLVFDRAQAVAGQLEVPIVTTSTNINQELNLPHIETHFYKTLFGVLSLRKLFKSYFYSSAGNFTNFNLKRNASNDTALHELLLLYVFSDENFQILSGGGGLKRVEKTKLLLDFEPAQNFLNVCIYPNLEKNCGKCGKCLRTLLTLDMYDALDKFRNTFDVDGYLENRESHMLYLKGRKKDIMLKEVYAYFFS